MEREKCAELVVARHNCTPIKLSQICSSNRFASTQKFAPPKA